MNLTCDRQELADALALAGLVVQSRTTRPVLQNVCLEVGESSVEVLATDLEVGLRALVERVDATAPGRMLLNAAHASAILRELQEDRVEIALEDGIAEIRAGGASFRLVADDPEEFPQVPGFEAEGALALDRTMLEAMLRKTAFAAASESVRYALNGVLFDLDGDRIRLVATDGKRLALCERPLGLEGVPAVSRVVSNKAVHLLQKLAGPEDEQLLLRFTENQVLAKSSRAVLSAQLVQGHFPPYQEVIPQGLDKQVELEAQPFAQALRRAALLTTKDSFAVRFAFEYGRLTLSARIPGVGESKIELEVPYEHDPIETAFNPHYLHDVLKVLDGQRLILELKENTLPCVLREGEGYRYVVMPIDLA